MTRMTRNDLGFIGITGMQGMTTNEWDDKGRLRKTKDDYA